MTIDRINLRAEAGDHTVSFSPPRANGERCYVGLEPDSALTYGYEYAVTHLDRQSLGRLLHWLQTGEALDRNDPRIPEPFLGDRVAQAAHDLDVVVVNYMLGDVDGAAVADVQHRVRAELRSRNVKAQQ